MMAANTSSPPQALRDISADASRFTAQTPKEGTTQAGRDNSSSVAIDVHAYPVRHRRILPDNAQTRMTAPPAQLSQLRHDH